MRVHKGATQRFLQDRRVKVRWSAAAIIHPLQLGLTPGHGSRVKQAINIDPTITILIAASTTIHERARGQKKNRSKNKRGGGEKIDRSDVSDGRSLAHSQRWPHSRRAWRRMPVAPSPVNMDESQ